MFQWQDFCAKNRVLRRILQATESLVKLTPIFKQTIGAEFAKHCQLAKVETDKITVVLDSAAWATKFRYALPDVLKNLRVHPEFRRVEAIVCRVSFTSETKAPTKKTAPLSTRSCELLTSCATQIKNSRLQQALRHLAGKEKV